MREDVREHAYVSRPVSPVDHLLFFFASSQAKLRYGGTDSNFQGSMSLLPIITGVPVILSR